MILFKSFFFTRTGINVGQELQMWPQSVEVGWVTSSLQCNCQFLDTLRKGCWGLQLHKSLKSIFGY